MSLFTWGKVTLHSGAVSHWKIDCDYLTDDDWKTLACMAIEMLPEFGSVEGVPTGGIEFAKALEPFATAGPLLIVDDVSTTGESFESHRAGREAIGCVVFNRGICPEWVSPIFELA